MHNSWRWPKARVLTSIPACSSIQSPPGNSYEKRTDAGKTVSEFNAHLKKSLPSTDSESASSARVKVTTPFPERNASANMSYMYTPLFDRALELDEQLAEYEELVKAHFKLEKLAPVGDPTPAQVTVVGRIVCEAAEGKLNPSVVQLEGTRKTCGGQRVLLDLSGVPNFQIFPGKVGRGPAINLCCSNILKPPAVVGSPGRSLGRHAITNGGQEILRCTTKTMVEMRIG